MLPAIPSGASKKELQRAAADAITARAESGEYSALADTVAMKRMRDALDAGLEAAAPYALRERQRDAEAVLTIDGAKVELMEGGIRLDYAQDEEWRELNAAVLAATEARKARETMLRAIPPTGLADPDTGALLFPPARFSTTTLKVTY